MAAFAESRGNVRWEEEDLGLDSVPFAGNFVVILVPFTFGWWKRFGGGFGEG